MKDKWVEAYTYLDKAGACFHLKEPLVMDDSRKYVMCWECGGQFKIRETDNRGNKILEGIRNG